MYRAISSTEQHAARQLIDDILARGLSVWVSDGDDGWLLKRGRDANAILDVIGEMETDTLHLRDAATGERCGSLFLVWGNSAAELIADYGITPTTTAVAAAHEARHPLL